VDVQITRLRRKIEADPKAPLHIQTVRGEGYKLIAQPEFSAVRTV
jgi:two-component system phosphate regulon response regulator OmpR